MKHTWATISGVILVGTLSSGCAPTKSQANSSTTPPRGVPGVSTLPPAEREANRDARSAESWVVQMEVFDLSVPAGSISRNSEFWKRVDEEFMGFERQVMLDKNGLRIGRATTDELSALSLHMDAVQPRRSTITARRSDDQEFEMRQIRDGQTLFVFDQTGEPTGRDFGPSNNLIYLSFRQSTRNPDSVRVALAPAVRSLRTRLEYTGAGAELQVRDRNSETRYNHLDLNFEIPPDHFVIVAPSSKGKMQTSLGQAFLTNDTPSERLERVLIFRPRKMQALGR